MLRDVLRLIYEKRMYSKSYIAKELNISEDMVEQIVADLLERELLMEDKTSFTCEGGCSGCPMKNCSKEIFKTYTVTDRGKKVLG